MDSKTWTNRLLVSAVVWLFLGGIASAQTTNFEKVRARFDSGEVFQAGFEHTYLDSYTQESSSSSGEIWINKTGYKLESENQKIMVDGALSRVYDGDRNRLIISEYEAEEDDFAPSRFLSGLDDIYTASEEITQNKTIITLTTDDDFALFVEVVIELNAALLPVKITAYDIADNIIVTTFSNGSFENANPALFELQVPENAEIVDMRY